MFAVFENGIRIKSNFTCEEQAYAYIENIAIDSERPTIWEVKEYNVNLEKINELKKNLRDISNGKK